MVEPPKKKRKTKELESWITELAKNVFVQTNNNHSNPTATTDNLRLTKEERKAKRAAKKQHKQKCPPQRGDESKKEDKVRKPTLKNDQKTRTGIQKSRFPSGSVATMSHRTRLNQQHLMTCLKQFSAENVAKWDSKRRNWNMHITDGPVKSNTRKRRQWDDQGIQPRVRDYGGIGLARPSLWVSFDDPSWIPQLEQEFLEHIPGFFGKQRTKAMKKQRNANMLWKQLLNEKQEQQQQQKSRKRHRTITSGD